MIMKTLDAISYYETTAALAVVLEITSGAISQWGEFVPEWAAARLDRITNGQLRYDHVFYMAHKRAKKQAA